MHRREGNDRAAVLAGFHVHEPLQRVLRLLLLHLVVDQVEDLLPVLIEEGALEGETAGGNPVADALTGGAEIGGRVRRYRLHPLPAAGLQHHLTVRAAGGALRLAAAEVGIVDAFGEKSVQSAVVRFRESGVAGHVTTHRIPPETSCGRSRRGRLPGTGASAPPGKVGPGRGPGASGRALKTGGGPVCRAAARGRRVASSLLPPYVGGKASG